MTYHDHHLHPFGYAALVNGLFLWLVVVWLVWEAIERYDQPATILAGPMMGIAAGGLVAGFDLALVVANLVPIVIAAGLIAFGLWKAPDAMTRGFEKFASTRVTSPSSPASSR